MAEMVDRIVAASARPGSSANRPRVITEWLAQFWSVRLPIWLDPWAPRVAEALADGSWTAFAFWRGVTALLPIVALAVGFLTPLLWFGVAKASVWLGPGNILTWLGLGNIQVYSESLWFMAVVIAGAILSGPVGVMLLIGYSFGDIVGYYLFAYYRTQRYGYYALIGRSIGYMLLGILAIRIPLLARRMAEEVPLPSIPVVRIAMRSVLYATGCGVLVYLWCQATIGLIRPVFTWAGASPSVAAIAQVQMRWNWLVATAMTAAVARIVLEGIASSRSPWADVVADLQQQRWAGLHQPGELWQRVPALVRVGLVSVVITFLLSGIYEGWVDALIVAITTAILGAWRAGLFGTVLSGWANMVNKVPALLRFGVGLLLGYVIAHPILHLFWGIGGFRPVLLGALLTLVVFHLLFPPQPLARRLESRQMK